MKGTYIRKDGKSSLISRRLAGDGKFQEKSLWGQPQHHSSSRRLVAFSGFWRILNAHHVRFYLNSRFHYSIFSCLWGFFFQSAVLSQRIKQNETRDGSFWNGSAIGPKSAFLKSFFFHFVRLSLILRCADSSSKFISYSCPGVAKVLLCEPEVAREPVFVARRRFSECKRMWSVQACHRSFFFKIERNQKTKKYIFLICEKISIFLHFH